MLETFLATLSPMLVMFLCIALGYGLKAGKIAPDNTPRVLSTLETYVLLPALTVNTFSKYCTVSSLTQYAPMLLISLCVMALAIAIAIFLSRFFTKDSYVQNVYKYALAFGNISFMGSAIIPEIFGEEMLYLYMLFTLPLSIAIYTWGYAILIPKTAVTGSPWKRLINPVTIASVAGIVMGVTGVYGYLPGFVTSTLGNLQSCMGPLAMILTGFVIGQQPLKNMLTNKKVYLATALRLLVFPWVFTLLLWVLGIDRTTLTLCMCAYSLPLGLNTVVFPAAYGGDTSTGAAMATVSHTLCIVTIPLMYALFSLLP